MRGLVNILRSFVSGIFKDVSSTSTTLDSNSVTRAAAGLGGVFLAFVLLGRIAEQPLLSAVVALAVSTVLAFTLGRKLKLPLLGDVGAGTRAATMVATAGAGLGVLSENATGVVAGWTLGMAAGSVGVVIMRATKVDWNDAQRTLAAALVLVGFTTLFRVGNDPVGAGFLVAFLASLMLAVEMTQGACLRALGEIDGSVERDRAHALAAQMVLGVSPVAGVTRDVKRLATLARILNRARA